MLLKRCILSATLGLYLIAQAPCSAAIVRINGKLSEDRYAPIYPIEEHCALGHKLIEMQKWEEALNNFLVIATHFPESPLYPEALFFSGVCYYFLQDYQMSDRQISAYLTQNVELQYFEQVFLYKYHIAEAFRQGASTHLLGYERLPKLSSGYADALRIYDEVISSLPHQELGAKALSGKAELLRAQRKFKDSIDTLNTLIKRFPKHNLAPDSYLTIAEIYVEESLRDTQNPDLLALAQININHFKRDFPGDTRVQAAELKLFEMQEIFASSLYDTGRFYERKKKPKASSIYYEEAIRRYPQTVSAEKSKKRLENLPHSNA